MHVSPPILRFGPTAVLVAGWLAACPGFAATPPPLTFAQRVDAQRRIERVYYEHRIWPKENQTPKPPFETMVPEAVIRSKVTDSLRKSAALDIYWQRPLTGDQLQAELDRMAHQSQDPAMLKELFAALGDDPRLIAETLAREILIDRLHQSDAVDFGDRASRSSGGWDSFGDLMRAEVTSPRDGWRLPEISAVAAVCDAWSATSTLAPAPAGRAGHTTIWTGAEMIVWGGSTSSAPDGDNSGGRYMPALDAWLAVSTGVNAPSARYYHAAIWTGSEMIIWGGNSPQADLNTGGRYNPSTDSWLPVAVDAGTPTAREMATAVWTGGEMIVWGGHADNEGGRYDPSSDGWRRTSVNGPVPQARAGHSAVWTGSEMIIWGGTTGGTGLVDGARYDPVSDGWASLAGGASTPEGRYAHATVWTGAELIIWSGATGSCGPSCAYSIGGGRYDPSRNAWGTTGLGENLPAARAGHTAVWTGEEMIVWGGQIDFTRLATGGRYMPASDAWRSTSTGAGLPAGRSAHTAIWTGDSMVVWGGITSTGFTNTGGIYRSGSVPSPGNSLRAGKSTAMRLNWSIISGAGSYNVKRCNPTTTGCIPGTIVSTPTINQYAEPNDGLSHFYAVEAVNECGATP